MKTAELDYELPCERIAQEPLAERDASRLLVVDRATGALAHRRFADLPELLAPGDVLVRNDSRVLPARLRGRRASGGRVELLLTAPVSDTQRRHRALARPAGRLEDGEVIELAGGFRVTVHKPGTDEPGAVAVEADGLAAHLREHGQMPLPPYIRRAPTDADRDRYQTVYARAAGSVAAPTAGLHFTERLLARLDARGVAVHDVTLEVGPGTFQPIRTDRVDDHPMHAESVVVPAATAAACTAAAARGSRVVAVGTTAVRALESAAAAGGGLQPYAGATSLFIRPGFHFRVVTALVTNFHQPRTTLLALVAAFAGIDTIRAAYAEALRCGYRFLSYGDAMLIR